MRNRETDAGRTGTKAVTTMTDWKPVLPDPPGPVPPFDPARDTSPAPVLWTYYILISILTGPVFFIIILPLYFRYHTLRYRFDDEGVSMSCGILFRREVYLTYRRIQDIHLSRNFIQRWMGLATVSVQTASGSSTPEMTIEGILDADGLRDFLYQRMRGARDEHGPARLSPAGTPALAASPTAAPDEALVLLREIRDGLARLNKPAPEGADREGFSR